MRKAIVILCLVLITGDLTKDGETVSHEYVVKKLDELAAGIMTLA